MQLNFIRNTDNFLTLLKQIHIENIKLSPSYQKNPTKNQNKQRQKQKQNKKNIQRKKRKEKHN